MRHPITAITALILLCGCGQASSEPQASVPRTSISSLPPTAVSRGDVAPGIPHLASSAASAAAFAPTGWRVEQQVSGDISRDGVPDMAFVLRKTDPAGIIRRGSFEPADINPRILAVALGGPGGFTLAGQDHVLIPTRDAEGLNMDDPFDDGLSIADGALSVRVDLFMNMGGADAGPYTFRYRYQDGAVRLIGYDHMNVQRMSGETITISANLLTGRVTTATGTIESDKETTVASRTALRALPMDQVGDAFAFETEKLQPTD